MRRPNWKTLGILASALAVGCGGTDTIGPGDDVNGNGEPTVATVQVTPSSVTLAVGETRPLSATALTATGQTVGASFTWRSLGESVATVSGAGLVTAEGPGGTTITASTGVVSGLATVTVTGLPPNPPSDLVAFSGGPDVVTLSWTDNSSDEVGFEVQRSLEETTGFSPLATTDSDVTEFVDESVEPGTTYYYRVRATTEGEASEFSNVAGATTGMPVMETLTAIENVMIDGLPDPYTPADGRDLGAELEALAPALVDLPSVLTVLVNEELATAQVVLTDGTTVLVSHNQLPFQEDLPVAVAEPLSSPGPPASSVPAWDRAVTLSIGGGAEVAVELGQLLSKAGYSLVPSDGTVESMRQFTDLGVLYLDSHGVSWRPVFGIIRDEEGRAVRPDFGPNPTTTKYGVETTTVIESSEDLERYGAELTQGDLIITLTSTYGFLPRAKVAITESFVERYWHLDNSIVILHTCMGGAGPFTSGSCFGACALAQGQYWDATPMRTAILGAGANAVLAFDNFVWPTTSRPAMEYFLDRLTGANRAPPTISPERRPFDLQEVRAAMADRGLMTHEKGGRTVNTIIETAAPDIEIIGVPSIARIEVTDDADQGVGLLEISGRFGGNPGAMASVDVGGQPATISEWTNNQITARTPFQGPGTVGNVVVRRSGVGIESNEVPLTEWSGGITVTVSPGQGTLEAKGEIDVKFRADVHRTRWNVEEDVEEPITATYISPATFGRAIGSGSFTDTNGTVEFMGMNEMEIAGKSRVDVGGLFSLTESLFGGIVTLDPGSRTAELCFGVSGIVTVRSTSSGMTQVSDQLLVVAPPDLFDSSVGLMGCLNLPMSASYVIDGGSRTLENGGATIRLEWTSFQPTSPPNDDTKG